MLGLCIALIFQRKWDSFFNPTLSDSFSGLAAIALICREWQGLQHVLATQTCSWISSAWCWLWLQVELTPLQLDLSSHTQRESWSSPTCLGLWGFKAWQGGVKELVGSYDVKVCRNQVSCYRATLLHSFPEPLGTWKLFNWYQTLGGHCRFEHSVLQPMRYRRTPGQSVAQSFFDQSNLWKLKIRGLALKVCCVCLCRVCVNPSPSCGYVVLKQSHNHFGLPALEITSDLWHATFQGTFTKCANTVFKLLSTRKCQVREPLWHETETILNWHY